MGLMEISFGKITTISVIVSWGKWSSFETALSGIQPRHDLHDLLV
jgi:hypothetical protein